MRFCSSSKVAVFILLTIDVYLCLNMSEDLNQIYCRRSLDMNGKTYSGKLPDGVKGEFGPGLRTHIPMLYHVANVSEPKIHEFLENMSVLISKVHVQRPSAVNLI